MISLKDIEQKAEEVLASNGIKTAPVPIEEIANKENILVSYATSNDFSGVLFRKPDVAFVALNSAEPFVRQRFTLAHELGHYFLHPMKNTFVEYRDKKQSAGIRSPKEIEANKFAAALLIPHKLIREDLSKLADREMSDELIKSLAKKYEVHEKTMSIRLMGLSALS